MTPVAGQVPDRQPGQQSAEHQPGHRPPRGCVPGEDVLGKIVEQELLDHGDQCQEAVRDSRDRNAQDRGEQQCRKVRLRTDDRDRIQRRQTSRWRRGRRTRGGDARGALRGGHQSASLTRTALACRAARARPPTAGASEDQRRQLGGMPGPQQPGGVGKPVMPHVEELSRSGRRRGHLPWGHPRRIRRSTEHASRQTRSRSDPLLPAPRTLGCTDALAAANRAAAA